MLLDVSSEASKQMSGVLQLIVSNSKDQSSKEIENQLNSGSNKAIDFAFRNNQKSRIISVSEDSESEIQSARDDQQETGRINN